MVHRTLHNADQPAVEAFLSSMAATSMFLRSNMRAAGIDFHGQRFGGTWAGAFEGERLVAVACQAWNGNLVLQAPTHLRALVDLAVQRPLAGLIGPWEQVQAARSHLGRDGAPTLVDACEDLFELDLADMTVPEPLRDGSLTGRRATQADLSTQIAWRSHYYRELAGSQSDSSAGVISAVERGEMWLVEREGTVVSSSAFNASLPDCVQIGGVFTPEHERRRGYARAAVAASLVDARDQGVQRAILFTGKQNVGAQMAYRALGFRLLGEYGLVLYAT